MNINNLSSLLLTPFKHSSRLALRRNMTTLPLPNGLGESKSIPAIGYGCWKVPKETCAELIEGVIQAGYRHIDEACDYGNEVQAGEGIRNAISKGICKREDLHVTSKLWCTYHHPDHVKMACQKTLKDLGLDYLDLYLIHFPISLKFVPFEKRYPPEWFHDPEAEDKKMELVDVPVQDTWKAMEALVDEGLVRNIGISNFNCQGIRDIMSYARIKPAVLQIEVHPYLQCDKLIRFAKSCGIHVTAFSPLGHGASYWNEKVVAIEEPVIKAIAQRLEKTPAQIVLRWGVQRGCSVIPKSANADRIKANLDVFSFELCDEDMKAIAGLNKNFRFNDPGVFCEAAFNTFCPIWE